MSDPRALLPGILHSPVRLGILGMLRHVELANFADVQHELRISAAELSRQLRLLEEDSLIEVAKSRKDRRTITQVRLTKTGRARFAEYLAALRKVVREADSEETIDH